MHKKNLYTKNGVVVSLVTFSIIEDNIETKLSNVMYVGASADYMQLKEETDYKLSYERTMTDYPEWKDLSIFVDYPGKSIFIHPENLPGRNIGCLCLSESKPKVGPLTYGNGMVNPATVFFYSTTDALESVRKLYEFFEPNLNGDKFIIRTNSEAKTDFQSIAPIKAELNLEVEIVGMKRDEKMLTVDSSQKDGE